MTWTVHTNRQEPHEGKFYGHDTMQRIYSQKPRNRIGQAFWAGVCVAVIGAIAVAIVISI